VWQVKSESVNLIQGLEGVLKRCLLNPSTSHWHQFEDCLGGVRTNPESGEFIQGLGCTPALLTLNPSTSQWHPGFEGLCLECGK
jgi:hypothetical protein